MGSRKADFPIKFGQGTRHTMVALKFSAQVQMKVRTKDGFKVLFCDLPVVSNPNSYRDVTVGVARFGERVDDSIRGDYQRRPVGKQRGAVIQA